MNANYRSEITPALQAAEVWGYLLKQTTVSEENGERKYIVFDIQDKTKIGVGEKSQIMKKMAIEEIVKLSKEKFEALRHAFSQEFEASNKPLAHEQISRFIQVSEEIANCTDFIIRRRQEKREINRWAKGVDYVASFLSYVDLYVGIKLWQDFGKEKVAFDRDIYRLDEDVLGIRCEIQELKQKQEVLNRSLLQNDLGISVGLATQVLSLKEFIPQMIDQIHQIKMQLDEAKREQFPLTTRSMVALQRANPLDRDESIALAMDEERYKGDASVMQPESGRRRELLAKRAGNQMNSSAKNVLKPGELKGYKYRIKLIETELTEKKEVLRTFIADIEKYQRELGLSFEMAAKLVHLRNEFITEQMPILNSAETKQQISDITRGIINEEHLDSYYAMELDERPAVLEQFEKDIARKARFKRKDPFLSIQDAIPYPPLELEPEAKIEVAAKALSDLILDKEKDAAWIPVLQLLVTQTNLNSAAFLPRIALTELGRQITWDEGETESILSPEFSEGELPPIDLEIVRNRQGKILKINVTVESRLDMTKRNPANQEKRDVSIKNALCTKLHFTVKMGKNRRAIIAIQEYSHTTSFLRSLKNSS